MIHRLNLDQDSQLQRGYKHGTFDTDPHIPCDQHYRLWRRPGWRRPRGLVYFKPGEEGPSKLKLSAPRMLVGFTLDYR
jgi:hypothetical protein